MTILLWTLVAGLLVAVGGLTVYCAVLNTRYRQLENGLCRLGTRLLKVEDFFDEGFWDEDGDDDDDGPSDGPDDGPPDEPPADRPRNTALPHRPAAASPLVVPFRWEGSPDPAPNHRP